MRVLIDDVSVESGRDLDDGVGGNVVERRAGVDVITFYRLLRRGGKVG
jgi:hypothetical protein